MGGDSFWDLFGVFPKSVFTEIRKANPTFGFSAGHVTSILTCPSIGQHSTLNITSQYCVFPIIICSY